MCDSIDCPITYARTQAQRDVEDLGDVQAILGQLRLGSDIDKDKDEGEVDGAFAHAWDW